MAIYKHTSEETSSESSFPKFPWIKLLIAIGILVIGANLKIYGPKVNLNARSPVVEQPQPEIPKAIPMKRAPSFEEQRNYLDEMDKKGKPY